MKAKELRELNEDELKDKEQDLSQELFNLRFQKATGQVGNTAMIGKTKKDLARVKGIINDIRIQSEVERG